MTRFLNNYYISCKLEECNIYNNKNNNIFFIVIAKNTTLNIQKNISNKKYYTLIFLSGNGGNGGNVPLYILNFQQSHIPTLGVFHSHSSHFPICRVKNVSLFLNEFLKKQQFCVNKKNELRKSLISIVINKLRHYLSNTFSKTHFKVVLKPPDSSFFFSGSLQLFSFR